MIARTIGSMGFLAAGMLLGPSWNVPLLGEESNPYVSIVDRNPFGLKEAPVQAATETPKETALPPPTQTIKLTGITSIFNKHKALLEVTEPTGGEPPRKLILSAGDRDGDIQVVSIDFAKDIVVIKTSQGTTNVTFAPIQQAAAPAAPRAPTRGGRPDPRSLRSPQSTMTTPAVPPPLSTGAPTIIGRGGRERGGGVTLLGADSGAPTMPASPATTGAASYNASATAANRLQSIPPRNMRTPPQVPGGGQPQTDGSQPAMNAEQLRLWIEANKMVAPELPWPTPGQPGGPPVPDGAPEGE